MTRATASPAHPGTFLRPLGCGGPGMPSASVGPDPRGRDSGAGESRDAQPAAVTALAFVHDGPAAPLLALQAKG